MQLYLLEMFTVVVESRRVTAAAKLLNLTQPAVSQQIRQLEGYFGVQLLTRGNQGVEPTPAGRIVYRHAKQMLAQFDCMEREIDDLMEEDAREVMVGATPTVGNFVVPCSLWTFKERFPKAEVRLEVGSGSEMAERVLDRSLHMAIIEGSVPGHVASAAGVKSRVIAGDYLVMVTLADSPWAGERLTTATLQVAPLILPGRGMGMREPFDCGLDRLGLKLQNLLVKAQLGGLEGMKSALESYGGVMVCTRMSVQKELKRESYREVTPEDWEVKVPFHLVCMEETLPPVARRFIRFVAAPEELASCWT